MITVNTGQCGNQLGYCILNSIYEHIISSKPSLTNLYYHNSNKDNKLISRTILIDTEPKVIFECLNKTKERNEWLYNEKNIHYLYGGAGNNWAMGYQMCSGELLNLSLNSIRYELEDIDMTPTIVIIHSVGGGTGSGLGTKITEEINDEVFFY